MKPNEENSHNEMRWRCGVQVRELRRSMAQLKQKKKFQAIDAGGI